MKHPFQKIVVNKDGTNLYAASKSSVFIFNVEGSKTSLLGSWKDSLDPLYTLKKQHAIKVKAIEEQQQQESTEENAAKMQKTNDAVKLPKLPTPGPGAPPLYNYIRDIYLTPAEDYFIGITDSDKAITVFTNDPKSNSYLNLQKRQEFSKRPYALTTSNDEKDLVIGDKFGDVYVMNLESTQVSEPESLEPILGHVSMLTSVLNLKGENGKEYIITSDRDEHIRISNYPKAYVIHKFLFQHNQFVSSIVALPWTKNSIIISGGGDDFLCSWKWDAESNELVDTFNFKDIVEPYVNDKHLAPVRFQNETKDLRETCVTEILLVESEKKIIVFCDRMSAFFVFDVSEEGKISHSQTVETKYDIISASVATNVSKLFLSVDGTKDDVLVESYEFVDHKIQLSSESTELNSQLSSLHTLEIESESDIVPLFTVSALRKRSEH